MTKTIKHRLILKLTDWILTGLYYFAAWAVLMSLINKVLGV